MGLFNRKKKPTNDELTIPLSSVEPTDSDSLIEIVAHQDAKKEIIDEAKKVNAHLKELLVQNGFTVKIYLAAHNPTPNNSSKTGVGKK